MKKLLYTLAVVIMAVACDKNDLNEGVDTSSINAVVDGVDLSKHHAAKKFLEDLTNLDVMVTSKNSTSTKKAGDNGSNWLQITFFNVGDQDFGFLRSDNQGAACAENDQSATDGTETITDVSEVIYTLEGSQLFIEVDGELGDSPYTIDASAYTATFETDGPSFVVPVNEARTAASAASHDVSVTL